MYRYLFCLIFLYHSIGIADDFHRSIYRHSNYFCSPALKPDLNNDGIVNYKDIWLVGRSFQQADTDYRYEPIADINCDKKVDEYDWQFVWSAYGEKGDTFPDIELGFTINIKQALFSGKEAKIYSNIELESKNKHPFLARVTQFISLRDQQELGEIILDKTISAREYWEAGGEVGPVREQSTFLFLPKKAGEYNLQTKITIANPERIFEFNDLMTVLPSKSLNRENKFLSVLSYSQNWCIQEGLKSYLYVYAKIVGKDLSSIEKVEVIEKESNVIYALYPDLAPYAKKGAIEETYLGGRIYITPSFIQNNQCKSAYVKINTVGQTIIGEPVEFCASSFNGEPFIANGLHRCDDIFSINLTENTSRQTLSAFLKKIDGKIIDYQSEINVYFVTPNTSLADENLRQFYKQLVSNKMVRFIHEHWRWDQNVNTGGNRGVQMTVDGLHKLDN